MWHTTLCDDVILIVHQLIVLYLFLKGVKFSVCDLPWMFFPQSFSLCGLFWALVQPKRLDHVLERFPANTHKHTAWVSEVMCVWCVCVVAVPLCAGPDVHIWYNFDVVTFDPELLHQRPHSDRRHTTHGLVVVFFM